MINIQEIIDNRTIDMHYQAIISPEIDLAAGVEALVRGYDSITNEPIGPDNLFQAAKEKGLIIELEVMLIEEAIKGFKKIYDSNDNLLLFINISNEFFSYAMKENYIYNMAVKHNVKCQNIALDIHPSIGQSLFSAKEFCDFHKKIGYYICLDDIGIDYNNLDMIVFLIPDIIKANIIKAKQLENQQYVLNIVRFANEICSSLGILTVAKGIENDCDVSFALKNNVKFMQGYYISKPQKLENNQFNFILEDFHNKIKVYKNDSIKHREHNRRIITESINITNKINKKIERLEDVTIAEGMKEIFDEFDCVENIWFLTQKGIEYMDSFINEKQYDIKKSTIFKIYNEGSDFSNKDLFRQLQNTILTIWVTDIYRSVISNNMCVSTSTYTKFANKDLILCINLNYDAVIAQIR